MLTIVFALFANAWAASPAPVVVLPPLAPLPVFDSLKVVQEATLMDDLRHSVDMDAVEASIDFDLPTEIGQWGVVVPGLGLPAEVFAVVRVDTPNRTRPVRVHCWATASAEPWTYDTRDTAAQAAVALHELGRTCGEQLAGHRKVKRALSRAAE